MCVAVTAVRFSLNLTANSLRHHLNACGCSLRGVLFADFGKGNGLSEIVPVVKEFVDKGVSFFMTNPCEHCMVDIRMYEAGGQFRRAGVIGLGNLPMMAALSELQNAVKICRTRQDLENHMIVAAAKTAPIEFCNPQIAANHTDAHDNILALAVL